MSTNIEIRGQGGPLQCASVLCSPVIIFANTGDGSFRFLLPAWVRIRIGANAVKRNGQAKIPPPIPEDIIRVA